MRPEQNPNKKIFRFLPIFWIFRFNISPVGSAYSINQSFFYGGIMRRENHKIEYRILLWKACHENCGDSLSIIYQEYSKPVCDYLRKTGSDGLAEDICQDVFTQIAAGQCHYDGSSDPKSYLFGIAGNIRNKELAAANKETYGLNEEQTEGDLAIEGVQSPLETLEQSELRRILEKEIANLPLKTRQAIE
ncbi:MAG: hypothetical protein DRP52_07105, partial [Planctomycetota bacterium]